jgi:hypothetical protein
MLPSLRVVAVVLVVSGGSFAQDAKQERGKGKPDEPLRKELLRMMKEDQDARQEALKSQPPKEAAARKVQEIDGKNTARMKEIIDKQGWPGQKLVGKDGAHAAWLLVQHADKDRTFQKRCLPLLERAVKAGEAAGMDLAYLTDRVRIGENKKQVYGTQFRQVEGKLEPFPIEDEANVDKRRKEVGLSTLAEYQKHMEKLYGAKGAKPK